MNAYSIDLNLLAVLDALLDERNVTKAARRVHLSQPAASNALARLRQVFGDPLLVRDGRGLVLTPRAEALVGPLRAAMGQIEAALETGSSFDPATSSATFTLATSDALQIGLLPTLLGRLASEAPGARLVCQPLVGPGKGPGDPLPERALATGEVDLAIGYFPQPPPHHHTRALFDGDFVCVARKDHPLVRHALSLRQFAELGHVVIGAGQPTHSIVDAAFAARKLVRRVAVVVPQYGVVPYVVMQSDHVAVLPRRLAEGFARAFPLQLLEPPLAIASYTISQVWHERTHRSFAHRWLREVVGGSVAPMATG